MSIHRQKGQVMIVSVILISGAILSTTILSGYLMIYHLRQIVNIETSAKSIFAADAGVEWELYKKTKDGSYPQPSFVNGAQLKTVEVSPDVFRSIGNAGRSARAFEVDMSSITP
ncbi:MAG: hypothetical protein V1652_03095 [bacterium]